MTKADTKQLQNNSDINNKLHGTRVKVSQSNKKQNYSIHTTRDSKNQKATKVMD